VVTDEDELAALEEHYLGCAECAKRAEESAGYIMPCVRPTEELQKGYGVF
jgi:hypothetical protein